MSSIPYYQLMEVLQNGIGATVPLYAGENQEKEHVPIPVLRTVEEIVVALQNRPWLATMKDVVGICYCTKRRRINILAIYSNICQFYSIFA